MKTMRKSAPQKPLVRNAMARHPLLGKSGRHDKSGKARRRAERVKLGKMDLEQTVVMTAACQSFISPIQTRQALLQVAA